MFYHGGNSEIYRVDGRVAQSTGHHSSFNGLCGNGDLFEQRLLALFSWLGEIRPKASDATQFIYVQLNSIDTNDQLICENLPGISRRSTLFRHCQRNMVYGIIAIYHTVIHVARAV